MRRRDADTGTCDTQEVTEDAWQAWREHAAEEAAVRRDAERQEEWVRATINKQFHDQKNFIRIPEHRWKELSFKQIDIDDVKFRLRDSEVSEQQQRRLDFLDLLQDSLGETDLYIVSVHFGFVASEGGTTLSAIGR